MKKFKKSLIPLLRFFLATLVFFATIIGFKEFFLKSYFDNTQLSNPVFRIDYALNEGAAFGILQQQSALLCAIAGVILGFILYYIYSKGKKISKLEMFSLSMISSGIISNTIERLNFGAVIDYINLNFITFPIFNFADVYICVGVIILLFILIFKR